jgi:hypothetical protein
LRAVDDLLVREAVDGVAVGSEVSGSAGIRATACGGEMVLPVEFDDELDAREEEIGDIAVEEGLELIGTAELGTVEEGSEESFSGRGVGFELRAECLFEGEFGGLGRD